MVDFLRGLRQHEMMSGQAYHSFQATHPDTKERIIKTGSLSESIINRHGLSVLKGRPVKINRLEYLNHIRGLSFGGKKHRGDRKNYKKKHVDVYKVQPGDTFKSIAVKELGDEREDLTIAVMNGKRLEDSLEPGEFLKLVRPGPYRKDTILEIRPDINTTQ
jgi:predicted Zn-dependent protease